MEGKSSSSSSSCPRHLLNKCFTEWMDLQELELVELVQAQQKPVPLPPTTTTTTRSTSTTSSDHDESPTMAELVQKSIDHFQDYADKRAHLAENDVVSSSSFFTPAWNSQLENSLLWIAGCRPSMFIRMLYALCGSQFEPSHPLLSTSTSTSHDTNSNSNPNTTSLGELTWGQMKAIDELHMRTVREEEKLTSQLASLQEDVADNPICRVVATAAARRPARDLQGVDGALEMHEKGMVRMLKEADKLRINTLKKLISVLTPVQAVDYLATGKNLHLTIHEWGKQKDQAVNGSR